MIPIESSVVGQERDLIHSKNELAQIAFTYGGNWDYDHGSFDRFLDEPRTVWLRIPFDVVQGEMDADVVDTEARIRFGQPFVLKHLYETGLDEDARVSAFGGFVNQFQSPANKDAEVEPYWVEEAQKLMRQVEDRLS